MTVEERITQWMQGREEELVAALAPIIAAESTGSEPRPGMPFGPGPGTQRMASSTATKGPWPTAGALPRKTTRAM